MNRRMPRLVSLLAATLLLAACGAGEPAADETPAVPTVVDPDSWVLPDLSGDGTVALEDLRGKPLVVTFFGPDDASVEDLLAKAEVERETGDQVTWLAVGVGDTSALLDAVERAGIDHWLLARDQGLLATVEGVGVPASAFYDQTGTFLGLQPGVVSAPLLRSGLFQLYAIGEGPVKSPTGYDEFVAQDTACGGTRPPAVTPMSFDAPDDQGLAGEVTAVITTSCGDIELTLDADAYPQTVNSFVFLARAGYYDGVVCHRLVSGFVLQCGDQTATGTSGPGYTIADEFPAEGFVYQRGVVAMANAGAGTTGSQFFIVIGDASFLDPAFSILGTVAGSEDALAKLEGVPLGLSARGELSVPLETVYIDGITVGESD